MEEARPYLVHSRRHDAGSAYQLFQQCSPSSLVLLSSIFACSQLCGVVLAAFDDKPSGIPNLFVCGGMNLLEGIWWGKFLVCGSWWPMMSAHLDQSALGKRSHSICHSLKSLIRSNDTITALIAYGLTGSTYANNCIRYTRVKENITVFNTRLLWSMYLHHPDSGVLLREEKKSHQEFLPNAALLETLASKRLRLTYKASLFLPVRPKKERRLCR